MNKEQSNAVKPFWSWNDKLDPEKLCRQIEAMKKSGINGFFMHARGGLITEYLSDEWFSMIGACLDKADELNMQAWAYDENGWPSGFADGIVPKMGEDFQQKWLVCKKYAECDDKSRIVGIYNKNGDGFSVTDTPDDNSVVIKYEVNPYYIDTFNSEAIHAFLKSTHEEYYNRFKDRFGSSLKGFFTDEPQYGNNGCIPWSQVIPSAFKDEYGYDLSENLPLLFFDIPGAEAFRTDFYNIISKTFCESFIKQMYDWCTEHNCTLTGHMMNEHSLIAQMYSTGGVMPCYEYFHEPGIDWLGRQVDTPLVPKQLSSVAAQLGKKTLTESFALCGWDVSLNELKWIAQWQYVNGVTSLCPHLEGYSLRGLRKRDYPASLFTHLPWFDDAYKGFADYFANLGELLDSGKEEPQLLVISMMQSMYSAYNPKSMDTCKKLEKLFVNTTTRLAQLHIPHHYGDEIILKHNGFVKGNKLFVGKCEYGAVLLPGVVNITEHTAELLLEFALGGGKIYAFESLPRLCGGDENSALLTKLCKHIVVLNKLEQLRNADGLLQPILIETNNSENGNIQYCSRVLNDDTKLYYLVSLADSGSEISQTVNLTLPFAAQLSILDPATGEQTPLSAETKNNTTAASLEFAKYASYVIIAKKGKSTPAEPVKAKNIVLNENFSISECTPNGLTLDFCSARINDGEWQKEKAVIQLQKQLLDMQKPCDIDMKFRFNIREAFDFESVCLCAETPEQFTFEVNGENLDFKDCGYYLDEAFRKCNIGKLLRVGENTIILHGKFYQRPDVYRVLYTPGIHETEINKLTLDAELESLYLTGDFSVEMQGDYTFGERRCIFGGNKFSLAAPVRNVDISKITQQGFWFFAGKMTLAQNVTVNKSEDVRYSLSLKILNTPAAKLFVNKKYAGTFAFAPFKLDVTELINNGENLIEIQLLSGNRNLLGPHHKPIGETYSVGPSTFTDQRGWSDDPSYPMWTDNYNFVTFGAEL